jgi:DNA-binding response OmpR family regulator
VVEDDISLRRLNTQMLSRSGYEVDGAADGAIAWQALSTDSYDLLVTAYDTPKLTGVELVRKVRAARMALPVVMATGTLPKEEFTRQPWLQPAAMLPKPYTAEEMLRTVKKVLHEAHSNPDRS